MNFWLITSVLAALSIAVIVIDLRTYRIPDFLNATIGVFGLVSTWALDRDLVASAIGVVAGYLTIATVNAVYRARRGHDGIGMGDAKFLAAAGAWVGWAGLPFIALIASSLGLVAAGALRLAGRKMSAADPIPFGPFLAIATLLVWMTLARGT